MLEMKDDEPLPPGGHEPSPEPEPEPAYDEPVPPTKPYPIGGPAFEEPTPADFLPSHRGMRVVGRARPTDPMVPLAAVVEQKRDEVLPANALPARVPEVQALQGDQESLLVQAGAIQVVDAASYARAAEIGQILTAFVKKAEALFNPHIERAYATWNGLTKERKAFIDPLQAAIATVKARGVKWSQDEEEKTKAAQRLADAESARLAREEADRKVVEAERARAQGDVETARELVQEAEEIRQSPPPGAHVQSAVPKVAGVGVRANWVHEVTDFKALVKAVAEGKVSMEALQANDTYLRGRAKTDKNTWACPGVRFFDKGSMALKSR